MTSDLAAAVQAAFRQTSPAALFHPERPAWQRDAACAGVDVNIFYPDKGANAASAKAVCAACAVRAECLQYALDTNERHGIFGGLSEDERKRIRPRRHTNGRVVGDGT